MNTKITAKDFFLHIAVIALLYTGTMALLNILFRVINVAFPQVTQYGYFRFSAFSLSCQYCAKGIHGGSKSQRLPGAQMAHLHHPLSRWRSARWRFSHSHLFIS